MRSPGFTLVELLVVIAIISILSGVVLASLSLARDSSRKAAGLKFHANAEHALGDEAEAIWRLDEGTGVWTYDSSGNGHTLRLQGTETWTTSGIIKGAITNPGGNGYAEGTMSNGSDLTVTAWVYSTNYQGGGYVVTKGPTNNHWSLIFVGSTGKLRWQLGNGTSVVECNAPANSKWHHIGVTQTGLTVRMYMDGEQCATATVTTAVGTANSIVQLGAGNSVFTGSIDEVRIYNKSLVASEIREEYFAGLPHTPVALKK